MSVFEGLKVLDTASFIAAPAAATILGDFGADVIKLEPPSGDTQRVLSMVPPQPRAQSNYAWHMTNRNKRAIAVDLKSPQGTEILKRLVGWADVVVVNTPHGAREKLHLGYDEVSAWNPRVVYADVTGFGDDGPDANLPGFDLTAYWSRSGLLSATRDAGAPPTVPVNGSGDHASAMGLYAAIVTALYQRERTGEGMSVGTSLLAEGVWASSMFVSGALAGGRAFGLHNPHEPTNPLINPYKASDGRWFMLIGNHWPGLAEAIGQPGLAEDARFADPVARAKNSAVLTEELDAIFAAQPFAHWQQVLDQARITYGVIQSPEEAAADPQLRVNDVVVPLLGVDGLDETVSSPITVRGIDKAPARRAPDLGEHNDEILRELGFTGSEIEALRSDHAIAGTPAQEAVR